MLQEEAEAEQSGVLRAEQQFPSFSWAYSSSSPTARCSLPVNSLKSKYYCSNQIIYSIIVNEN